MTAPDDDRARYIDIFRIREFSAVFVAHVASMLGNIVADVSLTVLVYQRTRSPALAAATMSLSFLPYLLGGTLLSSAATRWRTRRTLVICDIASAGIVAAMSLLHLPVVALLALVFVLGLIAPVFGGVRAATLTQILPPGAPYVLGRSVFRLVAQGAQVSGYAIGGLLLIVVSPRGALLIDAGSFLLSALILRTATRERYPTSDREVSVVHESMRNLRAVMSLPRLRRVLLVIWLLPTCGVAPEALAAPYVAHLGLPSRYVGFWLTAIPAGTVIADVVAARLLSRRWQRAVALPAMALSSLPLLVFAVRPSFGAAFVLLIVLGLGSAWAVMVDQEVVDAAPDSLRPAALSISGAGLMFFQGAGFGLWGLVAEVLSPPTVIMLAGAVAVIVVVTWRVTAPRTTTD
jgi:predicted MFS family arabinose efflux permease